MTMLRLPAPAHLLMLILVIIVAAPRAYANPLLVSPNDATSGALLLKSETAGRYAEAPVVATHFDVTVSGPIIRTVLTQHFVNPSDGWVEGMYVFPLPEDAAVDTLKMVVGKRIIIGSIKERQQARAIYEQAKAEGKKAALIEQLRPNLFTNAVANIGPHEVVLIQIEYQAAVRRSAGTFSFRLPTVVAPRYDSRLQPVSAHTVSSETPRTTTNTDDAPLPQPPVLDPATSDPTNPLSISVRLDPGHAITGLTSLHHAITASAEEDVQIVTLAETAYADRDFELQWTAAPDETPQVSLFQERIADSTYILARITPPSVGAAASRPAREMIFVIDNSGSMAGASMVQARASLIEALDRLAPGDTFNVIRFDDTMDKLFPTVVAASPANVSAAKRFAAVLQAEGGTEMLPALAAALLLDSNSNPAAIRQIIFLTDGAVSNEQAMFDLIAQRRGRSRIFMVGIGSAPNSFLMQRAAEFGRGTFTHIGTAGQVTARMAELTQKLTTPAVTGLAATITARTATITPDPLPDIYAGEPLSLFLRVQSPDETLTLSGLAGDRNWLATLDLSGAKVGKGIAKLWARRAIASTEVNRTLGILNAEQAERTILALALEHQLVSRLTSLVAVDTTPERPAGYKLTRADIPLNLPAGWKFEKVFGANPLLKDAALPAGVTLASHPRQDDAQLLPALPQGSTQANLLLLIGLLLCLSSLACLRYLPRRRA
jgi:Ca-activated chloride channel family protein